MITLTGIEKTYPSGDERISVLRGIDLSAGPGESVSITGESGSGKSTLLNIIGGLDSPDAGTVDSFGYLVHKLGEKGLTSYRAQEVGFVFQFHYLLKDFTALENVILPALMSGSSRAEARTTAQGLLEEVNVGHRTTHYPSELSGGERQRVALARALVNDPRLILADEPTGNLDEDHKKRVADLLFALAAERRKTLVLVTHDVHLADRAIHRFSLREGRLSHR